MRVPGWLVFLIFVPLQIWFFFKLKDIWGVWRTLLFFIVLGLFGSRAARAPWLVSMVLPGRAWRHERRRHIFQGILFIAAAVTFLVPQSPAAPALLREWASAWPQPWLPLAFLVTLLKAAVR